MLQVARSATYSGQSSMHCGSPDRTLVRHSALLHALSWPVNQEGAAGIDGDFVEAANIGTKCCLPMSLGSCLLHSDANALLAQLNEQDSLRRVDARTRPRRSNGLSPFTPSAPTRLTLRSLAHPALALCWPCTPPPIDKHRPWRVSLVLYALSVVLDTVPTQLSPGAESTRLVRASRVRLGPCRCT